jgi:hypothetical protein
MLQKREQAPKCGSNEEERNILHTESYGEPSTVATRSKAWNAIARSNAGIVGSNPTQGMDVCLRLFYVYVVLCLGRGLATGWSPVQGVKIQNIFILNGHRPETLIRKSSRVIKRRWIMD